MLDLEKHERFIIIFLILALLAGLGVIAYKKYRPALYTQIGSYAIERTAAGRSSARVNESRARVNINEAQVSDLMKLNGVGKVMAERIIEYRASEGRFNYIDDIRNVKGAGPAFFKKIKDDITVE